MADIAARLRRAVLYEGHGEESDLPEAAAVRGMPRRSWGALTMHQPMQGARRQTEDGRRWSGSPKGARQLASGACSRPGAHGPTAIASPSAMRRGMKGERI